LVGLAADEEADAAEFFAAAELALFAGRLLRAI
jgi:hypothetical protein